MGFARDDGAGIKQVFTAVSARVPTANTCNESATSGGGVTTSSVFASDAILSHCVHMCSFILVILDMPVTISNALDHL